jgi:hypothetical protein
VVDRTIDPAAGTTSFPDRSNQTLPVPLSGLAPVHRHSTAMGRTLRRHRSVPLMALAFAAFGCGVWLSTSPRSFDSGGDAAGVHIGDMTLTPVAQQGSGTTIFTGAATLVIVAPSPRTERAGAVMTWNGVPTTGRCVLTDGAAVASEMCEYEIGAARLTSTDSFTAATRTWHRRYSDGVEITIAVPAGSEVIPIPFPLGR